MVLDEPGPGASRGRLDKGAAFPDQLHLSFEDFAVVDFDRPAVALLQVAHGHAAACRVLDADRVGLGGRVGDRVAFPRLEGLADRVALLALHADHMRQPGGEARFLQVDEALDHAADDAAVTDRDVDHVGNPASQLLEQLDRDTLLPFDSHRVVGSVAVDAAKMLRIGDGELEGVVVGALDRDDGGSVEDALHQFVDRSRLRDEEHDVQAVCGTCAAHRSPGVSGGGETDLLLSMGQGLGGDQLARPVLEGPGREDAVHLEEKAGGPVLPDQPFGADDRGVAHRIAVLVRDVIGEEVIEGDVGFLAQLLELVPVIRDDQVSLGKMQVVVFFGAVGALVDDLVGGEGLAAVIADIGEMHGILL